MVPVQSQKRPPSAERLASVHVLPQLQNCNCSELQPINHKGTYAPAQAGGRLRLPSDVLLFVLCAPRKLTYCQNFAAATVKKGSQLHSSKRFGPTWGQTPSAERCAPNQYRNKKKGTSGRAALSLGTLAMPEVILNKHHTEKQGLSALRGFGPGWSPRPSRSAPLSTPYPSPRRRCP